MRNLIEKINKEKVKIFDLQQQLNSFNTLQNIVPKEIKNYESINLNELVKTNDQLVNENKQIEVIFLSFTAYIHFKI